MSRKRFFAPSSAFNRGSVTLAQDEAKYLREVLRLRVGDEVYVFDGEGREFKGEIEESRRDSARVRIVKEVDPAHAESPLNLTLAVALLKGEKFDLVVQKTTELGVQRIVPVMTKFADVRLRDPADAAKRVSRWQRIALEACKQSGRAVVPVVDEPKLFEEIIEDQSTQLRIVFSERDGLPIAEATQTLQSTAAATVVVGSEGGWSDEEIQRARDAGWAVVTLGGRTMRAETAAITGVALVQHLWGDLR